MGSMYHTFYTSAEKSFNHQAELFVAWDMSAYTRHILFVEKCIFRTEGGAYTA